MLRVSLETAEETNLIASKVSSVVFFRRLTSVQSTTTGFTATQFGAATDEPTPGDYDGDGRTLRFIIHLKATGIYGGVHWD